MAYTWDHNLRHLRIHGQASQWPRPKDFNYTASDIRTPWQKDRDRILYSSALRRLGAVSQVVTSYQSGVFHNRLTHTMKVAQVGRRLAEYCLQRQQTLAGRLGVDPDAVEAACLAHDLGHPPFGHIGEWTLDELGRRDHCMEGYEGNAQSFRVVTRLSKQSRAWNGLNLTRATLAALMKYPWARAADGPKSKKWGYYLTEEKDFQESREWIPEKFRTIKTVEAEIMDWADDITYSVHDIEDFHRAGCIPWHMFKFGEKDENNPFRLYLIAQALREWHDHPKNAERRLIVAMNRIAGIVAKPQYRKIYLEPYEGTRHQRLAIREFVSYWVQELMNGMSLVDPSQIDEVKPRFVSVRDSAADQVRILKQITRQFMHENTSLGAQQRGHRRIITRLYEDFSADLARVIDDIERNRLQIVPTKFHEDIYAQLRAATSKRAQEAIIPRLTMDCVAGLNETEAELLHKRLTGYHEGSVLDPIVA